MLENERTDFGVRRQIDEQYRLLLDKITDGIVVTNMNGIVQFANPAAEMLLDRSQNELLGRHIGLPVIDADTAEINIDRKDGKARFAHLIPIPDPGEGAEGERTALCLVRADSMSAREI